MTRAALTVILLLTLLMTLAGATEVSNGSAEEPRLPIRWRNERVTIAISSSLEKAQFVKEGSDIEGALKRSLRAWELAVGVSFVLVPSEKQNVSPQGTAGDGVNLITIAPTQENALLFTRDPENVAAATRVFYNGKGEITEADIVLSQYQQFSTDGSFGTFDLESTLTHEIGHLLGLDHSLLPGSTMNENYGRNGVYNLANLAARTLSASDIAAARAIYGAPPDAEKCCGRLTGRLKLANGQAARNARVWVETVETGGVVAKTLTDAEGNFSVGGLAYGSYRAFAERPGKEKGDFAAVEIARADLDRSELTLEPRPISPKPSAAAIDYVGFNGQLSDLSVAINAGRTFRVFLAGRNLDAAAAAVGSSSPHIKIDASTVKRHDYRTDLAVVSFDLQVDPRTPAGEYSLFVETGNSRTYLPGAVTVDDIVNPFGVLLLAAD